MHSVKDLKNKQVKKVVGKKKVGGKKKSSAVSIKSFNMKKEVKLICDICQTNGWAVQKATLSRGRVAAYFDMEWMFDKTVRTCTCITCGNMKWFAKKDFIKTTKNKKK